MPPRSIGPRVDASRADDKVASARPPHQAASFSPSCFAIPHPRPVRRPCSQRLAQFPARPTLGRVFSRLPRKIRTYGDPPIVKAALRHAPNDPPPPQQAIKLVRTSSLHPSPLLKNAVFVAISCEIGPKKTADCAQTPTECTSNIHFPPPPAVRVNRPSPRCSPPLRRVKESPS
jgi:hypothetical protein